MRQRLAPLLPLVCAVAVTLACWLDSPSFLRGARRHQGGWQWHYNAQPLHPLALARSVASFAALAFLLRHLDRTNGRRRSGVLLQCVSALALALGVVSLTRFGNRNPAIPLTAHELSTAATGYFDTLARFPDIGRVFREWPALRKELALPHGPYQPPFAIVPAWSSYRLMSAWPELALWLTRVTATRRLSPSVTYAAAGFGSALLSLAACALTPLFAVALLRDREEPEAIAVAAIGAAIPALLVHTPTIYQVLTPLFTATALVAQRARSPFGALASGCLVGVVAELSFLALALGNVVATQIAVRGGGARVRLLAALVIGTLLALGGAQAATGFSWSDGLFAILSEQLPEDVLHRGYGAGLLRNAIDVVVWCGPLPALGAAFGGIRAVAALLRHEPVDGLALGLLVGLSVLALSGAVRAEAGRLWMPYFPLIVIASVPTLRTLLPGRWLWLGAACQLVHAWALVVRWGS